MKILALGGCGQEGKTAVIDLLSHDDVEEIIIGDINRLAAEQFCREQANDKLKVLQLDVMDGNALRAAMSTVDVVANFVGPYYRFGVPVLNAAIETRTQYVDICDDYDATEDLLDLDTKAREAGITAIIGLGASPGMTNLAARHGADLLDQVNDIAIRWIVSITDVEAVGESAAVEHAMHIMDGLVPQYLNGEMTLQPATSEIELVEFPAFGESPVYFTGHPEPVTLPRYIENVQNVTCKGGCPGADEVLQAMSAIGLTSNEPLVIRGMDISPREVGIQLLDRMPMVESELPAPYSGFFVSVSGISNGVSVEHRYYMEGRMSPWTGTPAAIGVLMLGRHETTQRGVLAPEACLDPNSVFAQMAKRGLHVEQHSLPAKDAALR